jgi:hypothetical protein
MSRMELRQYQRTSLTVVMMKDCTHLTIRLVSMLMHNHIVHNNMASEESVWANIGVWYDLSICFPVLGS